MARQYDFEQVDVFTRERFRGNALSVFTDARGLSKTQMQDIARETNLSETTFVVPSEREDCAARVYIFTPALEMPYAGHPTVGTAWVLAKNGRLPKDAKVARLHENVGPVSVRLEGSTESPSAIFLTSPPVEFGHTFNNRAAIAAGMELRENDMLPSAPVQILSVPVPFLFVALREPAAVDRVALNKPALMKLFAGHEIAGIFVFAPQAQADHLYSRMLGLDAVGVVEDPATGSASGALGAFVVANGIASGGERVEIMSEQGTKMGRQSFIKIIVERAGEKIGRIEVGGGVVPVLRGHLEI